MSEVKPSHSMLSLTKLVVIVNCLSQLSSCAITASTSGFMTRKYKGGTSAIIIITG